MTRLVQIDEEAADEVEAQVRYYRERAGAPVALVFVAAIEAIYRGLAERRVVGSRHSSITFDVPVMRTFVERFPFASVFYVKDDVVRVSRWRPCAAARGTGAPAFARGDLRATPRAASRTSRTVRPGSASRAPT